MPVWTAFGTKSSTSVASVGRASAASPPRSPLAPSSPPHADTIAAAARATAATETALLAVAMVDREPRDPHVDPLAPERDPLVPDHLPLAPPLGERPVGADDALPRDLGVVARRHHRAGEARRLGTQNAVRGHEPVRDGARSCQDRASAGGVEHPSSIHEPPRPSSRPGRNS